MYLPSLSLLTLRLSPSLRCWGRRRSARSCRQQRQQSPIQRRRWSLTMGCCLMSFRVSRTSRRWRFCPETASRRYDQSFIPEHDSCCGYIDVLTHSFYVPRFNGIWWNLFLLQVKSVLTTLSGEELVQLRDELELIKDAFSLVEFDDEEVDEKKGIQKILPERRIQHKLI